MTHLSFTTMHIIIINIQTYFFIRSVIRLLKHLIICFIFYFSNMIERDHACKWAHASKLVIKTNVSFSDNVTAKIECTIIR